MSLVENLNSIYLIKNDIKSVLEEKGIDMTNYSFPDYPSVISNLSTGGNLSTLSVSENGTYYPEIDYDGFSEVVVDVPQSVTGYTEKELTEGPSVMNLSNIATTVCSYAFTENTYLQTVNLSECSVVNKYAFARCKNLQTVNLPACKSINNNAFNDCSQLSQISLPECVFINISAFYGCRSLSEVNLPLVSELNNNAFRECENLTYISLPECRIISENAFSMDYKLSEVYIPVCSSIGVFAFNRCSDLEKLTVGLSIYFVPSISKNVLSFTKIASGTGSIYVASDMYSRFTTANVWSNFASQFVSVEQSLPVLSYSDGLIYGLTRVFDYTYSTFLGITKQDVTAVSLSFVPDVGQLFRSCSNLVNVDLPACKSINNNAFNDCSQLSYISIPECTYIGENAFKGCISLHNIDLPVCSYIGSVAFYTFPAVSLTLTLGYSGVVTLTHPQLIDVGGKSMFSVYVPASLVDVYKSAQYWSNYSSNIFPIPE